MRNTILGAASVLLLLIGGCSSEQSTKEDLPDSTSTALVPIPVQAPPQVLAPSEPTIEEPLVSNDSLIAFQLEKARQHYLSAARAETNGDSLRTSQQYEFSIEILNELSYYPDIEANQDFSDLSRTVVEDYEKYIRQSGTLDSASSVFALREKLTLISEQVDSTTSTEPERVITGTSVPLVVNGLVDKHIQFFTNRGRVHMEKWIERSGKYFPMIKRILREEGVPEEMAYLAMVESGLNPVARSWARAVGMWQFMRGTGALYGLKNNFWYDERRDFEKATRAAARHLRDLYADFDDWYLVMAAYNSGSGKVYRAMRRSGSRDFWDLRRYLPRETRSYVPSFIATAIIAMNPAGHGFDITPADSLDFHYVTVDDCVDLDVLAECAGADLETIRELNPELIHRSTPPSSKGFRLRVPRSTDKAAFSQKYRSLPESKRISWLTHVVKRGDTLPKVAKHYGVSQQILAEANSLRARSSLKRGRRLMIPVARDGQSVAARMPVDTQVNEVASPRTYRTQSRVAAANASITEDTDKTRIAYKVKSGDTIGHIAEWYGVRATDIRNWNNLPFGRNIYVDQTLYVWVDKAEASKLAKVDNMSFEQKNSIAAAPANEKETTSDGSTTYVVKHGDNLYRISAMNGVTVEQIQRWNNLHNSRITPGDKLILYPVVKEVESAHARRLAEARAQSEGKSKQIIYVVKRGDTISQIAQQYEVQASQIRAWNSLKRSNRIYAGQELIIRKDTN